MKSRLSPEASAALASLVNEWPTLKNDVQRALAIEPVAKLQVTTRVLAEELGCSETQVRNILRMAKASSKDLLLAQKGEITSRELVRRAKRAEAERKVEDKEALDRERTKAAQVGCKTICDWLEREELWPSYCENIINETRWILHGAELNGTLPKGPFPRPETPMTEIIQRCKPNPDPQDFEVAWYARWLAIWSYYAFPDSIIRDRALDLALNEQIRRH